MVINCKLAENLCIEMYVALKRLYAYTYNNQGVSWLEADEWPLGGRFGWAKKAESVF